MLALLTAGVPAVLVCLFLVFADTGPDTGPARTGPAPSVPVPVLPARSPGADGPESGASAKPSASASATASPSVSAGQPSPKESPSSTAGPATGGTLRMGDRGSEVRALQERLFGQGFTYVSVTGVYDAQTRRAVAQLQRDRDLKGDQPGVYGPYTRQAFGI
ncbi:peptidoglycan-binding domain-containing protein [Streptomyces bambusae]|uniref:Peptidoglycan binding-like domain-containing protein n=1 Tax=Streptomyces bambusae TaxID=1550616 RepID=A0ABS6ZBN3_9ACTN|nr:peptidoglycan-binding domain-containing protein [Streptomyces bambusae]MBW5485175.1 hypothetical protein [Streptomyces bambusae]